MQVASRSPRRIAVIFRQFFPFLLAAVCLFWLLKVAGELDLHAVLAVATGISAFQWVTALGMTGISFAALGRYDVLFHRWLDTPVSNRNAARSGAASIALSQTLGFGLITGTLARWRALPELSFARAAVVTQYVSFSFMVALGVLCAALLPLTPWLQDANMIVFSIGALGLAILAACCSLLRPTFLPFYLPPIPVMARLCLWAAIDVACAASAFYVLLPTEVSLDFWMVFAAFAIALNAGLLSGTPGGVGPFEISLFALLPSLSTDTLLATILAFRLIYYALPAVLGMACLVRPQRSSPAEQSPANLPVLRAETEGLLSQAGHDLKHFGLGCFHVAETSQCLVIMADETSGRSVMKTDFEAFAKSARDRGFIPAFYKSRPATAGLARKMGWTVLQISEEAVLLPSEFTLEGRAKRQLRRKLKQAEARGITVCNPISLPVDAMEKVGALWSQQNGGERGFSMGRFDRDALRKQMCFLAYDGEDLVAFATFHKTPTNWCLDLMRSTESAPDGTMHTLIVSALQRAAELGVGEVSLAAMPSAEPNFAVRMLTKGIGLRQFKLSFAPRIQPLYLVAPSPLQLGLAGLDILLRIRFPDTGRPTPLPCALQKLQSRFSDLSVVNEAACSQIQSNRILRTE